MSGDIQATPPAVVWAQRSSAILLTICLEDCKSPEIKIDNDKVYFKGIGGPDKKLHEVTINLYSEIDCEKSLHCVRDRIIEFVLKKKEEGPFWPQLTKEKVKHHWLKVDFNKWKDEDDSEDEVMGGMDGPNLEEMMASMGGLGGGGGAGANDKPDMDDMEDGDSDDGELPDLE